MSKIFVCSLPVYTRCICKKEKKVGQNIRPLLLSDWQESVAFKPPAAILPSYTGATVSVL
jgi:hypothetical protein